VYSQFVPHSMIESYRHEYSLTRGSLFFHLLGLKQQKQIWAVGPDVEDFRPTPCFYRFYKVFPDRGGGEEFCCPFLGPSYKLSVENLRFLIGVFCPTDNFLGQYSPLVGEKSMLVIIEGSGGDGAFPARQFLLKNC